LAVRKITPVIEHHASDNLIDTASMNFLYSSRDFTSNVHFYEQNTTQDRRNQLIQHRRDFFYPESSKLMRGKSTKPKKARI